jgi:sec-independent protein translocase protein TatB
MFGMGFTEILLIAVVAILFLGPDKLPDAMVKVAKFFKSVKKAVGDAKSAIDDEIKISELKEEALGYKAKLDAATNELQGFKNLNPMESLNSEMDSIKDSLTQTPKATPVEQKQDESVITKRRDGGKANV